MFTLQSLASLLITALCAILWFRKSFRAKCLQRNLRGPPSPSWLTGNLMQLAAPDLPDFMKAVLKKYGSIAKIHGICGDEYLYISDPLALRELLNDPSLLIETPVIVGLTTLIFGQALGAVQGAYHKKQRKMLNPLFAPNHLRSLFPTISRIASQTASQLEDKAMNGKIEINMADIFWRTLAEMIGQAGFGYSFKILDGGDSLYLDTVQNLLPALGKLGLIPLFLPALLKIGPPRFRRFIVDSFPWKASQECKYLIDIIDRTGRDILSSCKSELEHDGKGNLNLGEKNIMTSLLRENQNTSREDRLTEAEVLDQINLFVLAGSETTTNTLARILETVARHPDVQRTLRNELIEAGPDRAMSSFEVLNSLPFLDAVVKETLRLYPIFVKWERIASRDITVPLLTPIIGTDGQKISQIAVAKNQTVIIGIAGCNSDPGIWGPDAGEWKPQRWLEQLPTTLINARIPGIYSHMMTFLGGDRSCIGYNLAIMEIKTILAALIPKLHFELADSQIEWKTSYTQYPLVKGETQSRLPLKVSLA